eukprot:TRINITY_DN4516_c0_g1_i1.p1 TRINITY_DN4516_c0_g1~~TRINITY_DN4516_c0_g1_i1.p1  ORF type:complete len:334 (+),score=55.60 TRINITY_DN4516_c0_g1_i1:59-1060(+)
MAPRDGGRPKTRNPLKPAKAGKTLLEVAEETLEIVRGTGVYHAEGTHVSIAKEQRAAVEGTTYHHDPLPPAGDTRPTTNIVFQEATSLAAAERPSREGRRVCVLNFASGHHPGGGFRTGARAQEESLARASGLFPTLTRHMAFYGRPPPGFYTDRMIYSPQVPVIRNDALDLLPEPFLVDFVTAAAVNIHGLKKKADLGKVGDVMRQRCRKLVSLCQSKGAEVLVLGAWGTGVFRQEPGDVAEYFRDALAEAYFDEVVFAMPEDWKLVEFEAVFKEEQSASSQRVVAADTGRCASQVLAQEVPTEEERERDEDVSGEVEQAVRNEEMKQGVEK